MPTIKLLILELCLLGEKIGVVTFGVVTTAVFGVMLLPPLFLTGSL